MDISKIIAENLSRLMDDKSSLDTRDTLIRVAEKSGVGFGTVRRTKKGDGNITVEKLEAIASVFGKHAVDLMTPGVGETIKQSSALSVNEPSQPFYTFKRGDPLSKEIFDIVEALDLPGKRTLLKLAKVVAEIRVSRKAR